MELKAVLQQISSATNYERADKALSNNKATPKWEEGESKTWKQKDQNTVEDHFASWISSHKKDFKEEDIPSLRQAVIHLSGMGNKVLGKQVNTAVNAVFKDHFHIFNAERFQQTIDLIPLGEQQATIPRLVKIFEGVTNEQEIMWIQTIIQQTPVNKRAALVAFAAPLLKDLPGSEKQAAFQGFALIPEERRAAGVENMGVAMPLVWDTNSDALAASKGFTLVSDSVESGPLKGEDALLKNIKDPGEIAAIKAAIYNGAGNLDHRLS